MFSTFKQKLLLGVYTFVLLTIPVGSYLVSQYQTIRSSAQEKKNILPAVKVAPKPATSAVKELLSSSQQAALSQSSSVPPSATPAATSPTIATSYGPTLSFKISLEGSPKNNQTARMFVGIAEGTLTSNPKFLLSFTVDVPASGEYSNLSLAGLNPGTIYTALLKGSAQIATSSAFTMSPAVSNLNNGEAVNLVSGDLNDDNVINSSDYSIVQKILGATAASANWNANADLNKDGVINSFDLAIVSKNLGKAGATGTWTSPLPQNATPSASLNNPAPLGGPANDSGYWIWIPK